MQEKIKTLIDESPLRHNTHHSADVRKEELAKFAQSVVEEIAPQGEIERQSLTASEIKLAAQWREEAESKAKAGGVIEYICELAIAYGAEQERKKLNDAVRIG